MGMGRIYSREREGLVPLNEAEYDAEKVLQRLLADYPDLLAGHQIRPESPPRWLLITQEVSVPDSEGSGGRWALDHLFVDQDAIPTLVEVKRRGDTRGRREVVGQMLDYAANLSAYWPSDKIRSVFEERCRSQGLDADEQVLALLAPTEGPQPDEDAESRVDAYWASVSDNLARRNLRLMFVSDVISRELQSIVEFLNEGLKQVEVLAVEVKQYVGEGRQILVPRLIGLTAKADRIKRDGSGTKRVWDEDGFYRDLKERRGDDQVRVARTLLEWGKRHSTRVSWGDAKLSASFYPIIERAGIDHSIMYLNSQGRVTIPFGYMKNRPPFDDAALRSEYRERLEAAGLSLTGSPDISPNIWLSELVAEGALERLISVLDWAVQIVEGTTAVQRQV